MDRPHGIGFNYFQSCHGIASTGHNQVSVSMTRMNSKKMRLIGDCRYQCLVFSIASQGCFH